MQSAVWCVRACSAVAREHSMHDGVVSGLRVLAVTDNSTSQASQLIPRLRY
jgi:hypothetical protein